MTHTERERVKRRLERLAWLTDSSIPLPGLQTRVGIDPLLGLLPWVGDTVGALLSSYIIAEGARLGAPRSLLVKMAFNVAVDAVVGAVPGVGDLFDFAWKANARNVRLLERFIDRPHRTAAGSRLFVAFLSLILVGFVVLIGLGAFWMLRLLWQAATGG